MSDLSHARLEAARQSIADFQTEREAVTFDPERAAFWCGALSQTVKDLLLNLADEPAGADRPRTVTIDLDDRTDWVLTEALREFAHRQRGEAESDLADRELADDPAERALAQRRQEWAQAAEELLERIEAAP
jgi:hypothetical protein